MPHRRQLAGCYRARPSTQAKVMGTTARSSAEGARLLTRLGRFCHVIKLGLAAAGDPGRLRPAVARDPRRSGHDGPRSRHRGAGWQHPGFRHVLVLVQNHGPSMDPRNHRDMHPGDHARMHTRDNAVVNERHHVNANHRLHLCDRHDAVDMAHIVRPGDIPVFDLVYVTIFRSRDDVIARASYVAVSVDIADSLYRLVPIDRTYVCAGNWMLAAHSVTALRLCRQWGRDDHRTHQSCDTSQRYC